MIIIIIDEFVIVAYCYRETRGEKFVDVKEEIKRHARKITATTK